MEPPPTPSPGPNNLIPLSSSPEHRQALVAQVVACLTSPAPHPPLDALELLEQTAFGNSRQAQISQSLLFSLAGEKDPSGFEGQGLLELRALDRSLSDPFLTVLHWWCGPTQSDQPLYDVLQRLHHSASL